MSPAEEYLDFHYLRAHNGASTAELNVLLALAHYFAQQEGEAYHRGLATYGSHILTLAGQAENPQ